MKILRPSVPAPADDCTYSRSNPDQAGPDWDLAGLRERVAAATARSGRVVVHAMPDAARASVDTWGPLPPSFALMRTLKDRFDPHGLCNPGRYLGGL